MNSPACADCTRLYIKMLEHNSSPSLTLTFALASKCGLGVGWIFIGLHRMSQATHVSLGVHFKLESSNQQVALSGNKKSLKYSLHCRGGQKWAENATQTRHVIKS